MIKRMGKKCWTERAGFVTVDKQASKKVLRLNWNYQIPMCNTYIFQKVYMV